MKEEIIQTYQGKIFSLYKNNPIYEARKEYFENKMDEELDAVESFEKSKNRRKRKHQDINLKITESLDPRKTKIVELNCWVVELNNHDSASIKSFAVKIRSNIMVTTRFLSGKMLMFTKLLLKRFIYDLLETFCFPDEKVKKLLSNIS